MKNEKLTVILGRQHFKHSEKNSGLKLYGDIIHNHTAIPIYYYVREVSPGTLAVTSTSQNLNLDSIRVSLLTDHRKVDKIDDQHGKLSQYDTIITTDGYYPVNKIITAMKSQLKTLCSIYSIPFCELDDLCLSEGKSGNYAAQMLSLFHKHFQKISYHENDEMLIIGENPASDLFQNIEFKVEHYTSTNKYCVIASAHEVKSKVYTHPTIKTYTIHDPFLKMNSLELRSEQYTFTECAENDFKEIIDTMEYLYKSLFECGGIQQAITFSQMFLK